MTISSQLPPLELSAGARLALGQLLPLLGCGEEAAALAFDILAEANDDSAGGAALRKIAEEERVHDALLRSLANRLDLPAAMTNDLAKPSRGFHQSMSTGDSVDHLARIAALDSAVCLILSTLLRRSAPLTTCPVTAGIFRRIARDEAGHVRIARAFASARGSPRHLVAVATPVREMLADVLDTASDAFEALECDPHMLIPQVSVLPAGLFL